MAHARTYTKNVANYMSLGNGLSALLSGLSVFSVHAKIRLTSVTAGVNDNNILTAIIDAASFGFAFCVNGASSKLRVSARSVLTDSRQAITAATTLSLGVDYFVGVIVDVAGKTLTLYLNGVIDAGPTAVTFANTTWTVGAPTNNDAVGGFKAPPTASSDQFDGLISELAVWKMALTTPNFASLAGGATADTIQLANLPWYLKNDGLNSPELPTVGSLQGVITGSLPVEPLYVFNPIWALNCNQPGPEARAL